MPPTIAAFFKKLDLAHYALILAFLVSTVVPDVVKAETLVGLASWLPVTLKIGTYLSALLMLLKQFAPATPAPDSIEAQAAKLASRGFVSVRALVALALAGIAAAAAIVIVACQNGQLPPSLVPDGNLGICILTQYATAPACRPTGNWVACVGGIAAACGADAAAVEQTLAAHKHAMIADGFVLPPPVDAGGQ